MKLTLIRHGQSVANVDRSIYNTTVDWDIPLSDIGVSQAEDVKLELEYPSNTVFLTSHYKRARDTGSIIHSVNNLAQYNITIKQDPLIHELLVCSNEEDLGNTYSRYEHMYQNRLRYYKQGDQCESYLDCYMRARLFINSILSGFYGRDTKELIVVSHGCFMQMMLANLDGISIEDILDKEINNCEIIIRNI